MKKEQILKKKIGYAIGDSLQDRLLDAMGKWAKQESIEFARWLNKEGWKEYDEPDRWICPSNNRSVYLTSKLYELFKKANP